jgi:type IX secretion system PorP/SprF family membrane protein
MKKLLFSLGMVWCVSLPDVLAQDPSFSQFFMSPLNINPALTGNISGQWRAISNIRSQWSGPVSPYNTGTVSFDSKLLREQLPESSILGIGGMLMYDRAMDGALTSTYASLNGSYMLQFAESQNGGSHRIGLGIGGIFGHRRVDYNKLNFSEQFDGRIFNTNLPTGEVALSQMKPYISASFGFLYNFTTEGFNLDLGFAEFHANKPKQSFLEDEKQILPTRYVGHANFELALNELLVLSANGIYQRQSTTSYFSVGSALGYLLDEQKNIFLNAGLWYWSKNAIVPYAGFTYQNFQLGLSYDLTVSKLASNTIRPNTFEISMVLRGDKERNKGIIYCPIWK